MSLRSLLSFWSFWLLPIVAMAAIAPFTPAWDLAVSHYFYDPHHTFSASPFYTFLFDYGPMPADLVCVGAVFALALSFCSRRFRNWRQPSLVLVLTMAIGAGLVSHALFKDHWGRPRPKQTIEFGGRQPFRPFYQPNIFCQPEPSKSFPCGHCTMGFYFFAPALVARRYGKRRFFWGCLLWALLSGVLLAAARIAQGGHFFSDTLAAALIMWLTAYCCDRCVYGKWHEGDSL